MITKVIVILLICSKLDYTTSLPDIIRIGEGGKESNNKKSFFVEKKILFHAAQGDAALSLSVSLVTAEQEESEHKH
jgi:hypothetical protein